MQASGRTPLHIAQSGHFDHLGRIERSTDQSVFSCLGVDDELYLHVCPQIELLELYFHLYATM